MSVASDTDSEREDALPEADRLEGFVHPRETIEFYGHAHAEKTLLDAVSVNRLHHAWLLSGPEGVGKATLAYRFARFLLSRTNESAAMPGDLSLPAEHPVFSQVAALSHPGLLVLRRPWMLKEKRLATEITVSEARRLRRFFGHTAGAGQWRVVIIDRAEELNASAANALLKNLEEPPLRCVFLLVCSTPGRVPVTIRSRCRAMRFGPLSRAELERAVRSAFRCAGLDAPDETALAACLPLAQGSAGRALRLLEAGGSEIHERLVGLLADLPRLDHQALHDFADELTASGARASYDLFFDLAGEALARIVAHAATGEGALGVETEVSARLGDAGALAQWAGLWETVQRAKAQADALNLDRKNTVLGTFFRLEETARQSLR